MISKSDLGRVEQTVQLPEALTAPIQKGDCVGSVINSLDGQELGRCDVTADEDVKKIGFFDLVLRILQAMSIF